MNQKPKREDYPTDDAFIEAMAKHHGIDPRMCKQLPQDDYLKAENVRLKIEVKNITDENDRLRKHLQKMGELKAKVERLERVEAAIRVIADICGERLDRYFYYKINRVLEGGSR